jgi:hypothetical protein
MDRPLSPRTGFLALTFGTLLSSQGADAHRSKPFGSVSGQPFKPRRGAHGCQTRGLLAVPARAAPPEPGFRGLVTLAGPPRDRPPLGVRHSLPGDGENTKHRSKGLQMRWSAAWHGRRKPEIGTTKARSPRPVASPRPARPQRDCACRGAGPASGRAAGRPRPAGRRRRRPGRC